MIDDGAPLLLDLLQLEELDRDLYRADNIPSSKRASLYGGQVAAQALMAAALTVPEGRQVHSLHSYFLRRGVPARSTILRVARDRDGGTISAREVLAIQNGEVIFSLSASFHLPEEGVEFQAPVPDDVIDVDDLEDVPVLDDDHRAMIETRPIPPPDWLPPLEPGRHRTPRRIWVRSLEPVGAGPLLNACVVTFMSDLGAAFGEMGWPGLEHGGVPSLDHALWFHRPVRTDEWLLLHLEPLSASGARGLYHGAFYTRDMVRVASVTQETMLRPMPPRAPGG